MNAADAFREEIMAVAKQTMTDEQRKSVVIEYLKAFDNGGETSDGGSILDLFADDAQVYFPKWGIANGKEQIGKMFRRRRRHAEIDRAPLFAFQLDLLRQRFRRRARARVKASIATAPWRAGVPEHGAGRWCDVFEIRDWKIQRVLHLSRSRLRRQGHRAISVAEEQIAKRRTHSVRRTK